MAYKRLASTHKDLTIDKILWVLVSRYNSCWVKIKEVTQAYEVQTNDTQQTGRILSKI